MSEDDVLSIELRFTLEEIAKVERLIRARKTISIDGELVETRPPKRGEETIRSLVERRSELYQQSDALRARMIRLADPTSPSKTTRSKFPQRAVWLKSRLAEKNWTIQDLARESGIDGRTLQKVLDGKHVVENTLDKIENFFKQRPPAA